MYERTQAGWTLSAIVENPAERPFVGFARSMDLDGDRLAVGVIRTLATAAEPGRVYTFRPSGAEWAVEGVAEAPVGASAVFGEAGIALDGQTLAVADVVLGAVYVYRAAGGTWTLDATLTERDLGPGLFGSDIDLSGDRLVVGVQGREVDGRLAGAAFVYVRSASGQWTREAEIQPPNDGTGFARDVAISGDRILVGSNDSEARGRAYAFVRDGSQWRLAE